MSYDHDFKCSMMPQVLAPNKYHLFNFLKTTYTQSYRYALLVTLKSIDFDLHFKSSVRNLKEFGSIAVIHITVPCLTS